MPPADEAVSSKLTDPLEDGQTDIPALQDDAQEPLSSLSPLAGLHLDPGSVTIHAEQLDGRPDSSLTATGNVEVHKGDQTLFADKVIYEAPTDEVTATGNVRLQDPGNVAEGPYLRFNLETRSGEMDNATFQFLENRARGSASKAIMKSPTETELEDASYTTCPIGQDDWFLRAKHLDLNRVTNVGTAQHASVAFMGVPLLYTPWMTFPLNKQRKSGFLSPSLGNSDSSGAEFMLPYYWNIAPNQDATIAPRYLSKRGAQLIGEYRYLEPQYGGSINLEWLPNDNAKGETRHFVWVQHQQTLGYGFSGSINYQEASDDDYFRDLTTTVTSTSRVNLPREGSLHYSNSLFSVQARAQSYQTLQDAGDLIVEPYDRLPQVSLSALKQDIFGADLTLSGEFVSFDHPDRVDGERFTVYPSVSLPLPISSFAHVTPKIGYHFTDYSLNRGTSDDESRALPIVSVDSGINIDRFWTIGQQRFIQTVEPRIFYLYIPFRDQDEIPTFDTADADFNYAQLFAENRFVGGDRVGDANEMTFALVTRLLETDSGRERVRAAIGQRLLFDDQRVTLSRAINSRSTSDLLATFGAQITDSWAFDTGWQYDTEADGTRKLNFGTYYRPGPGKSVNFAYRFIRDSVKQFDVSAQWPLTTHLSGLARWNYSMRDDKTLEALAGLEYDGGCWVVRLVGHRLVTESNTEEDAVFVHLELNDLAGLGSNPLSIIKRSVTGYHKPN
ncbi:MAG: LPS-assembly protein LptD [Burkholderiales bacterium]